MDLLNEEPELDLFDNNWRIYSVNPNQPPQYLSEGAEVTESLVNEGCVVYGTILHSVLFQGVTVGQHSFLKNTVVMPDAVIGNNVYIENAIVPSGLVVPDGMVIRSDKDIEEVILVTEELVEQTAGA
jgi:glucose-1-phosphate adenylyltransferase